MFLFVLDHVPYPSHFCSCQPKHRWRNSRSVRVTSIFAILFQSPQILLSFTATVLDDFIGMEQVPPEDTQGNILNYMVSVHNFIALIHALHHSHFCSISCQWRWRDIRYYTFLTMYTYAILLSSDHHHFLLLISFTTGKSEGTGTYARYLSSAWLLYSSLVTRLIIFNPSLHFYSCCWWN